MNGNDTVTSLRGTSEQEILDRQKKALAVKALREAYRFSYVHRTEGREINMWRSDVLSLIENALEILNPTI